MHPIWRRLSWWPRSDPHFFTRPRSTADRDVDDSAVTPTRRLNWPGLTHYGALSDATEACHRFPWSAQRSMNLSQPIANMANPSRGPRSKAFVFVFNFLWSVELASFRKKKTKLPLLWPRTTARQIRLKPELLFWPTNHFRLNGAADRLDLPLFVYFPDSNVIRAYKAARWYISLSGYREWRQIFI